MMVFQLSPVYALVFALCNITMLCSVVDRVRYE